MFRVRQLISFQRVTTVYPRLVQTFSFIVCYEISVCITWPCAPYYTVIYTYLYFKADRLRIEHEPSVSSKLKYAYNVVTTTTASSIQLRRVGLITQKIKEYRP